MITAETTTESIRNVSRFLFFVIMSRKWYLIIFFFASFTAFSRLRPPHVQVVEPVVVPPVLVKPVSGMVSPASALTAQSSVAVGSPSAPPEIALANGFKDLPVNFYTGSGSFSLPIYNFEQGALCLPLALQMQYLDSKRSE